MTQPDKLVIVSRVNRLTQPDKAFIVSRVNRLTQPDKAVIVSRVNRLTQPDKFVIVSRVNRLTQPVKFVIVNRVNRLTQPDILSVSFIFVVSGPITHTTTTPCVSSCTTRTISSRFPTGAKPKRQSPFFTLPTGSRTYNRLGSPRPVISHKHRCLLSFSLLALCCSDFSMHAFLSPIRHLDHIMTSSHRHHAQVYISASSLLR